MNIEIQNLNLYFKEQKILSDININIKEHEFVSILGPSGCGKSTLLKTIAGINTKYSGEVLINAINIKQKKPTVAYMSQNSLMLPWLTVKENLRVPFILDKKLYFVTKKYKKQIDNYIYEYINKFGIEGVLNKYPNQISGGEKSRVALLRSFFTNSQLMLLDEPFASLDSITKQKMQLFLYNNMYKKYKSTTILITHDIDEAILLSNTIYVLNQQGNIVDKVQINLPDTKTYKVSLSSGYIEYKARILEALSKC